MRKITVPQIATFSAYLCVIVVLVVATTWLLASALPNGDFRGVTVVFAGIVLLYVYGFVVYRVFLRITPLTEGELAPGSAGEFATQVDTLFYLVLFYSLIRTHFLPIPLLRLVYLALGARLGANTYGGVLLDPPLTAVGANCIIGHDAVLFAHAIEGERFSLQRIVIGDNVTVGAHAVVMSGVRIGDGAIVSAGAVVGKGTRIGAGEVWGGVPARLIRSASQSPVGTAAN
ncbi:MAG: DapH/DapD/GlmU-related protein [Burkholderiaceae bacterium]